MTFWHSVLNNYIYYTIYYVTCTPVIWTSISTLCRRTTDWDNGCRICRTHAHRSKSNKHTHKLSTHSILSLQDGVCKHLTTLCKCAWKGGVRARARYGRAEPQCDCQHFPWLQENMQSATAPRKLSAGADCFSSSLLLSTSGAWQAGKARNALSVSLNAGGAFRAFRCAKCSRRTTVWRKILVRLVRQFQCMPGVYIPQLQLLVFHHTDYQI